jgi:hypothetical protein
MRGSGWLLFGFLICALVACGSSNRRDTARRGSGGSGGTAGSSGSSGSSGKSGDAGSSGAAGDSSGGSTGTGGGAGTGTGGISGSGNAGGEGGGDMEPVDALVTAFCTAARACCEETMQGVAGLVACEQQFPGQVDALGLVRRGTVLVNDDALSACIDAYKRAESSCTLTEVFTECHGMFVGTLAAGDSCTDVLECARDAGPMVCLKIQDGVADPNVGTCTVPPRGTMGTECAGNCALGADCSTTNSSPDDSVPLALCHEEDGLYCPLGETCSPIVSDGTECTWNEACGSDGFCVSTCGTRGDAGDECLFDYECEKGLTCSDARLCVEEPLANAYVCAGHPPTMN